MALTKKLPAPQDNPANPKPNIGQAYDLLNMLNRMDAEVEAGQLKLSGVARIAHLVNVRLLLPLAQAFEQARNERFREILGPDFDLDDLGKVNPKTPLHPSAQAKLINALIELRTPVCEIALQTYTVADLRLDDNPQIGRVTLEILSPIISDIPAAPAATTPLAVVRGDAAE